MELSRNQVALVLNTPAVSLVGEEEVGLLDPFRKGWCERCVGVCDCEVQCWSWVEWLPPDDNVNNVNVQRGGSAGRGKVPSVSVLVVTGKTGPRHRRNRWPLACYVDRKMARFCPHWSELRFVRASASANTTTTTTTTITDIAAVVTSCAASAVVGKKSTIRRKRYRVACGEERPLASSGQGKKVKKLLPLCQRVGGEYRSVGNS